MQDGIRSSDIIENDDGVVVDFNFENCQHIYLFLSSCSSEEEVVVEMTIVSFIRIMFIRQCSILYIVVCVCVCSSCFVKKKV